MENLINSNIKLNLGDLSIVPAPLSKVRSRKECLARYQGGQMPYFVAPMDTVLDTNNTQVFLNEGLNVCLPRGIKASGFKVLDNQKLFESVSLEEFITVYCDYANKSITHWDVLIDIANGHMYELWDACRVAKEIWGDRLTLMVGNIANPKAFHEFTEIGVDYIRLGIGGGRACTTTTHTGVHYPMASLIMECKAIANRYKKACKIIADGGISNTADINIALACGADFVMMGSIFNKTNEACGQPYVFKYIPITNGLIPLFKFLGIEVKRTYRGMSTVQVQKSWNKVNLRPSEGIYRYQKVEFSLNELLKNIDHRLQTAMSYTGDFELETYVSGETELIQKTNDTYNRVNK